MANRHMKRCSMSLVIREKCKLKPPWDSMSYLSEWLSPINQQARSAGEDVEKGVPFLHCWWECRLVQPLWKAVWRYLRKLKMELPYDSAIPLLGIYPKKPKMLILKNIRTYSLQHYLQSSRSGSSPCVHQKMTNWTTMGHIQSGILLSHKQEEKFTLCDSMDGPGEHYATWNKPIRERQIPYDFTHIWNLMTKMDKQAE